MLSPDENRIGEYDKIVGIAANKFRKAAEYDDLYQEGMIAVWLCPPDATPSFVTQAVYYRMKDWVRYIKRLRHFQSADYDEIVGSTNVYQTDD